MSLVKTMLDDTEFAVPTDMPLDSPTTRRYLSAGVLRVWATIFKGAQTWAIVEVIGRSPDIFANMLEPIDHVEPEPGSKQLRALFKVRASYPSWKYR